MNGSRFPTIGVNEVLVSVESSGWFAPVLMNWLVHNQRHLTGSLWIAVSHWCLDEGGTLSSRQLSNQTPTLSVTLIKFFHSILVLQSILYRDSHWFGFLDVSVYIIYSSCWDCYWDFSMLVTSTCRPMCLVIIPGSYTSPHCT